MVTYERAEEIGYITLRRPEKLNALNDAMRRALLAAFMEFESDAQARVVVLRADGRAFCAGADLTEMADTALGAPAPVPHLGHTFRLSKPSIAQVQGVAYAGGFLLAQMCDLCTASTLAQFGMTEVRWGRGAPWATPLIWMLPQRVMMEMLITGEPLPARRAYELGFVNRLCEHDQLADETAALARIVARNAPLGVKAGRDITYMATEVGRSAALPLGELLFQASYASQDAIEGPRAFRDGRRPVWQGC